MHASGCCVVGCMCLGDCEPRQRCAGELHATGVFPMKIRIASASLVALGIVGSACAQEASVADDVQQGHRLAIIICANCHIAARDQPFEPILRPPAPSFESIVQRSTVNADSVGTFLTTTHRDISTPGGMPNPQLLDFQIKQVAAYLLSLRKQPVAAPVRPCSAEIARVEMVLDQAQANRQTLPSARESAAARLHRQPTPQTVAKAEAEAKKKIDAALALARKLDSEGKDTACVAALEKIALPLGVH
jgi:mono/diheme cytochrome c family protein